MRVVEDQIYVVRQRYSCKILEQIVNVANVHVILCTTYEIDTAKGA